MRFSTLLATASSLAATLATSADPIVIKGSHFFYETNGTEFIIQGVAYQYPAADTIDPLATSAGCQRDIPHLLDIRTNLISVYAVDPTQDHSDCMNMLADAGIYVLLDLANSSYAINRASPAWDVSLYDHYTSVVDEFASYTNVLGFVVGNEVANNASNSDADAFVKAAVRDMKSYIKSKNYRAVPIGYAADDAADIRYQVANYFDCGDSDTTIDFYGLNNYEWCGQATFQSSGYAARTAEFASFNIPVFLSEYGCNDDTRYFTEVQAIFGPDMAEVWSGGVVFEYFQDINDYGLVSIDGSSVSYMSDYTVYSKQMASITPSPINSASYTVTNTVAAPCPTANATWDVSTNLPPTPNDEVCSCMVASASCVPSSDLSADDTSSLLGIVCGQHGTNACDGINYNGSTGVYGVYSPCDTSDKLVYALNAYYKEQSSKGNAASACAFGGSATLRSPSATGSCSSVLSSASAQATNTASSSPGGTAASSTSKAAGSGVYVHSTLGLSNGVQIALYLFIATATGVSMVLL